MSRVLTELLVNEPQVAGDRTHGGCAYALDLRVLLQDRKQLQERRRRTRERLIARGLEGAAAHLEACVQRQRRLVLGKDRLAKQLQQELVEEAHVHHRAVVALHELLNPEGVGGIFVAEGACELDLMVKQQAVLAPAGQRMQTKAHLPQQRLRLFEAAQL